jgi:MFS-type transporter involved in bile tolerance (Atg22 family)
MVFAITGATGSQRLGMVPIFVFLTLGLILISLVPGEEKVKPT